MGMLRLKKTAKKMIMVAVKITGKSKVLKAVSSKLVSGSVKERLKPVIRQQQALRRGLPDEKKEKKTVYFDISSYAYTTALTGIQRVVQNFIKFLPEILQAEWDLKYVSAVNDYRRIELIDGGWVETERITPGKGDIFLVIDLTAGPQLLNRKQLLEWKKNGCKLIACVHDITFLKYPEYMSSGSAITTLKQWFRMVLENYDGVMSVSKTVMEEIRDHAQQMKTANRDLQYGYFHHGSDFACLGKHEPAPDMTTFIAVSTVEPRKGYLDLIEAFEKADCPENNMKLIIVGRRGWKCDETVEKLTSSPIYGKRMFWYSDCGDEELKKLYLESDYYVSASFYEGFGIGIVEAASFGLPVIVRDIPVYREIVGENGAFFASVDELKELFERIGSRQERIDIDLVQYRNWKQSIQMAFDAARTIAEK